MLACQTASLEFFFSYFSKKLGRLGGGKQNISLERPKTDFESNYILEISEHDKINDFQPVPI